MQYPQAFPTAFLLSPFFSQWYAWLCHTAFPSFSWPASWVVQSCVGADLLAGCPLLPAGHGKRFPALLLGRRMAAKGTLSLRVEHS